jgi:hypothetical protein
MGDFDGHRSSRPGQYTGMAGGLAGTPIGSWLDPDDQGDGSEVMAMRRGSSADRHEPLTTAYDPKET